ncbi:uncharacterized protein LOC135220022 isoform X2 [Macrobrachium nipponense]|uniref:uncharacterized protein LOC135220022 isoform X2 n=1 Tax=Macrobrachium nipponense TaxID=159736 RepID=UPI0030C7C822
MFQNPYVQTIMVTASVRIAAMYAMVSLMTKGVMDQIVLVVSWILITVLNYLNVRRTVGECVKDDDWGTCYGLAEPAGCLGNNCTCCRDCTPNAQCIANQGYCYNGTSSYTCTGTIYEQGCGEAACHCCINGSSPKPICSDNNGYSFSTNSSHVCNGITYDEGCDGPNCACCFMDPDNCVELPECGGDSGRCVKDDDLGTCYGLAEPAGCLGNNCTCCRDCTPNAQCTANQGYCYNGTSSYMCTGTIYEQGCGEAAFHFCINDTSLCVLLPGCVNSSGSCIKPTDWSSCNKVVDSTECLGDDCACRSPGVFTKQRLHQQ